MFPSSLEASPSLHGSIAEAQSAIEFVAPQQHPQISAFGTSEGTFQKGTQGFRNALATSPALLKRASLDASLDLSANSPDVCGGSWNI